MKLKHKLAYMCCAIVFSQCSSAKKKKVGCVLVKNNRIISCGYNALPEHIDGDCEYSLDGVLHTRPEVRHAERNCLKGLEKSNESSVGGILFCTHSPCINCAIDIVDAGISKVYYLSVHDEDGIKHLKENGIYTLKFSSTYPLRYLNICNSYFRGLLECLKSFASSSASTSGN